MGITVRPWGSDKSGFQKMWNEKTAAAEKRKKLKEATSKKAK